MKKILLIAGLVWAHGIVSGQLVPSPNLRTITPSDRPIFNPYQFPNYYQNNASYINNSMQNNRPAWPAAGPYTGNGDYLDPTKDNMAPPVYGNTTNPPATGPAGQNTSAGQNSGNNAAGNR